MCIIHLWSEGVLLLQLENEMSDFDQEVIDNFVGSNGGQFDDIQQLEEFVFSCGVDVQDAYTVARKNAE